MSHADGSTRSYFFVVVSFRLLVPTLVLGVAGSATAGRPSEAPPVEAVIRVLGLSMDRGDALSKAQKASAQRVGQKMISLCPHCRLSTIDEEGPCGWARAQRRVIQNAVAEGHSEEDIVAAYVRTYGPEILALEPDDPARVASWAVPYVAVFFALSGFVIAGIRLRRRAAAEVESDDSEPSDDSDRALDAQLTRELEDLD